MRQPRILELLGLLATSVSLQHLNLLQDYITVVGTLTIICFMPVIYCICMAWEWSEKVGLACMESWAGLSYHARNLSFQLYTC